MFFKNFRKEKKKTDRAERRWNIREFGLGTRIIVVNFQSIGKYDNLRVASNIIVSNTIALFGRHLATSAVIR